MVLVSKFVVGVFSREDSSTYQWLIDLLLSAEFHTLVKDVRPVAITNAACGGSGKLAEEIKKCTFSILYHSKRRGRLNITNVTDSLYDQELRDLSMILGRDKVLVLVDDLDDDDGAHHRITAEQPLISELAGLMVVFCQSDKPLHNTAESYQRDAAPRVEKNIAQMKRQMSSGSAIIKGERISWVRCLLIVGVPILLIVLIIILCVELVHH
ncbi:uncharacterized protein LOC143785047 [Ranitomeya variabilis]|uniref:uncharacterized protein LOC143785047 n=1 Tax=Ranitomeya variabilis TaxID=490064 RepID=UPI00405779CB